MKINIFKWDISKHKVPGLIDFFGSEEKSPPFAVFLWLKSLPTMNLSKIAHLWTNTTINISIEII